MLTCKVQSKMAPLLLKRSRPKHITLNIMKTKRIQHLAAVLAVVTLTGVQASASTLLNTTSYGGHTYELWDASNITWQNAKNEAIADGGYLAVLTDSPETSAVYSAFLGSGFFTANAGQEHQAWLGGFTTDPGFTTTNPNAWAWVTGEAWTAFDAGNFAGGEPNGDSSGLSINRFGTPQWNDEGGTVGGYIVEKNVSDASSTLALFGGSISVLGALRRKFRS